MSVMLLTLAALLALPPSSLVGEYAEARSNHVYTCGCFYSGEAGGGREAILAWRIRSGEVEGVSLTGLSAVAVVVGVANLGWETTTRESVLYVDGRSSRAQQNALVELLKLSYPNALGSVRAVHAASMSFDSAGDMVRVSVPDVLQLTLRKARLPEDAELGAQLWYPPFVPMQDSELGTMLAYRYSGADFGKRWNESFPEIRGFFGTFSLTGRPISNAPGP